MDTKISYSAICAAFDGDDDICRYCDPSIKDATPEKISLNVYDKLLEWEDVFDGTFRVIDVDGAEVGFVYYFEDIVVSFGINKAHRNKEFLGDMFEKFTSWAGEDFVTFMWENNTRAIKWLERCGMQKEACDIQGVIKLKHKSCL